MEFVGLVCGGTWDVGSVWAFRWVIEVGTIWSRQGMEHLMLGNSPYWVTGISSNATATRGGPVLYFSVFLSFLAKQISVN